MGNKCSGCSVCKGSQVSVIYLVQEDGGGLVVKSDTVDVWTYLAMQQICKYFYDVREWQDPDSVISRATSLIGSTGEKLPFKDPQHFVMWCKTGSYQLHH